MVPLIPNDAYEPPAALADFAALVNDGKVALLANVTPEVQSVINTDVQSMLLGTETPASLGPRRCRTPTTSSPATTRCRDPLGVVAPVPVNSLSGARPV